MNISPIDPQYFREYRQKLGFNSQDNTKKFFAAKDIEAKISYDYIDALNQRLHEVLLKVNSILDDSVKCNNIETFYQNSVITTFEKMKASGILPKLNNQGRRPEEVYFSWIRGYSLAQLFEKSLKFIFECDNIKSIGDDDFSSLETFKRTPKADFEILVHGDKIRIEAQTGFQGINDIKQHKVLEAKKLTSQAIQTWAIHFDLFNGQVAFVRLDSIEDNDVRWITRQQMEGQTVFAIDQNSFLWKITNKPVIFPQIKKSLKDKYV